MYIQILRHDGGAVAERTFSEIASRTGYRVDVVDPRLPLFRFGRPDVVLSRCELDSFFDPLFSDYMSALYLYEREGIPVVNSAAFLVQGQDKFLAHLAVEQALQCEPIMGCDSPRTVRVHDSISSKYQASLFLQEFGGVVVKLPCSGRGLGVWLARSQQEVRAILDRYAQGQAVLLQQPIEKEASGDGCLRDMRLQVVRHPRSGRPFIACGYYRIGDSGQFLTNVSRGGTIAPIEHLPRNLRRFCSLILDAVHGDVAGIDIARDTVGRYWFEEVNIAFETKQTTLNLLGDQIWRDTLTLCKSRVQRSVHFNHRVAKALAKN